MDFYVDQLYILLDNSKLTGAYEMNTIHAIMVIVAIASIPAFIGVQQAIAGSSAATATVTIAGQCELNVGAMGFAGGDPLTDCAACGDPGVGQLTVNLANANGNLESDTQVQGINWRNAVFPSQDIQSVFSTVYSATVGAFGSKTPLQTTLASIVVVPQANNVDTFWDVSIDLDLDNDFAATANQTVTFDFTCTTP